MQQAAITQRANWSMRPLGWFLLAFYALAVLWGARSAFVVERQVSVFFMEFLVSLSLAMWATADARQRQQPIPRSLHMWFLWLATILVPGYVLLSRGWRGIGWVVLNGLAWIVVATLAMNIAGFLYFGVAW